MTAEADVTINGELTVRAPYSENLTAIALQRQPYSDNITAIALQR